MDLRRSSASTNLRVWRELRNYGVPIGVDAVRNQPVYLKLSRLATHLSVIGPTGFGKTRWLLRNFRQLLHVPKAAIVFLNPKGAAGRQARDIAIEEGQQRRLDYFRPGDTNAICGYNPMLPNGLPIESHAKSVRESIRSAHGQMDFALTRQLARMLYLALVVARANGLGLVEALQLLRPGSRLRSDLLPTIEDPQLKEAFAYFHGMRDQMQQELALSAIAMLEPFVTDATIRRVLTHMPSLDLRRTIHEGRVLIVDIPIGQPLRMDDVKLLGRFFTNDLANSVLERNETEAREHPVFFIVDEAPLFLTEDFCHILRLGREPGLHAIIAHQDLEQLRAADPTGNVYASVMGSCRTKIVFGGLTAPDCRTLAEELFFEEWNPMAVKDEIESLEIEPVESTRQVVTRGQSTGGSLNTQRGTSKATAYGKSRSLSRQSGGSHAHSNAVALAYGSSTSSGMTNGETTLPDGQVISIASAIDGAGEFQTQGTTSVDSYGEFQSEGATDATSDTETHGTSASFGASISQNKSENSSEIPFIEPHVRRVVSSRKFWSEQEVMTLAAQKIKQLPERHFLVKTDGSPAIVCRAWDEPGPRISDKRLRQALAQIYSAPYYRLLNRDAPAAPPPYQLPMPEVESPETPPRPPEPTAEDIFLR